MRTDFVQSRTQGNNVFVSDEADQRTVVKTFRGAVKTQGEYAQLHGHFVRRYCEKKFRALTRTRQE